MLHIVYLWRNLEVMTVFFQNVSHENVMLVIQFQQLHFVLDYGIKYRLCLYQHISVFDQKQGPTLKDMVLAHFITQQKMGHLA